MELESGMLKREIGLGGAMAYGVGIIVGAGIYGLIGKAAGHAGNSLWISFVLAAVVASFTGLSYAELSSMFPTSSAEYAYVQKASGSSTWAFVVGWLVFISGVISSAAVAIGFGGYLKHYVAIPESVTAVLIILLFSLINLRGIRESVKLNIVLTIIEVLGLVLVIAFGVRYFGTVNYFENPQGIRGVVSAAALIFFAYIGFESLVKIGEETKDPKRTIPKALLLSMIVSTALYCMVGLSVISILPYNELAASTSPLADVALKSQGPEAYSVLSIIALFATGNTVLIILIANSRILYGMARESAWKSLARVKEKTGAPYVAISLTAILAIPFALVGDIEIVANVTNFSTFLVFLAVNLALILLKDKQASGEEKTRPILRLRSIPIPALLGIISCFAMLLQFDPYVALTTVAVTFLGLIIYKVVGGRKETKTRTANQKKDA